MTTMHHTDHNNARNSRGAFPNPMEFWGDWMEKFTYPKAHLQAKKHHAEEMVDHYFHVLGRILEIQREVAKSLLADYEWTAAEVSKEVHEVAKETKKDMHDGAKDLKKI